MLFCGVLTLALLEFTSGAVGTIAPPTVTSSNDFPWLKQHPWTGTSVYTDSAHAWTALGTGIIDWDWLVQTVTNRAATLTVTPRRRFRGAGHVRVCHWHPHGGNHLARLHSLPHDGLGD